MKMFMKRLEVFRHYKPLLQQLVMKDIKLKYRRSFLGYVWSILNPLMIMFIMVLVFQNMFRFDIANYPVYLIIGQTIFNFVSEATNQAMWSITGNAQNKSKSNKSTITRISDISSFKYASFSNSFLLSIFKLLPFSKYKDDLPYLGISVFLT